MLYRDIFNIFSAENATLLQCKWQSRIICGLSGTNLKRYTFRVGYAINILERFIYETSGSVIELRTCWP